MKSSFYLHSLSLSSTFGRSVYLAVLACAQLGLLAACGGNPSADGGGKGAGTGGDKSGAPATDDISFGGAKSGDGSGGSDSVTTKDAVCGNKMLEIGELCDDGNTKDSDGCSADCSSVDPDYLCVDAGVACVRVVTCGNGVLEGSEGCDDGNTKDGDGCAADCSKFEAGYSCVKPGTACVLLPLCGNGVRERGEACDDGATATGDGCSATCQLEDPTGTVWQCPPTGTCVAVECGDGNRTRNEACDDGGNADGDGCSADCEVETGYRCSASGCRAVCGDGLIVGGESCDDGVQGAPIIPTSGDGCSAACKVEANFSCSGEPSTCESTIVCGNASVDPGEVCDPGVSGQEDCYGPTSPSACGGYAYNVPEPVCGNGVLELGEACDGGSACIDSCTNVSTGWECPSANYCIQTPVCGDEEIQQGEQCDPGAVSIAGCDPDSCAITTGYFCSGEPSVCVLPECGNGTREGDEECDDGNTLGLGDGSPTPVSDGCSATCTLDSGWVCPPDAACLPVCGDGIVHGIEQCDNGVGSGGVPESGDGCSAVCQIEVGFDCGNSGTNCVATSCPNGVQEYGEGCDDGNSIAGDGCGPTCQIEPAVAVGPSPVVAVTCGDGLISNAEECDDGNSVDFDGCSSSCTIEAGWYCDEQLTLPSAVDLKIKYRDFKHRDESGGHPQFKPPGGSLSTTLEQGITGAICTSSNSDSCGRLDAEGKPQLASGTFTTIYSGGSDAFKLWYRDTNDDNIAGTNGTISMMPIAGNTYLKLTQNGGSTSTKYVFDSDGNNFYPLDNQGDSDGDGIGNGSGSGIGFGEINYSSTNHNWHFTSEVRYFFRYARGQELQFYGDDDVWVYVNGRLAVDIGGIHNQANGRVILGDQDWSCSKTSTTSCALSDPESTDPTDDRFDITVGNVYEIVVFQAERNPTGSNYKLTLDGFLSPRSSCYTVCGDESKAGPEFCDSGDESGQDKHYNTPTTAVNNDGNYGQCRMDCSYRFCGDGIDEAPEACDNGSNTDVYVYGNTTSLSAVLSDGNCAPGCEIPEYCGDDVIQWAYGETCDDGVNDGSYGGCSANCRRAAYCGDGQVDGAEGEQCDTPGAFKNYQSSQGACDYNCKWAGYCGDGVRNGTENCDPNDATDPRQAFCTAACDYAAACGDGLQNIGEACDYGLNNSGASSSEASYNGCSEECTLGPHCGDGTPDLGEGEECDLGELGNTGAYDGCTAACLMGPSCGDGILQSGTDEQCDNGYNEDEYAYDGVDNPCGADCKSVPYCGDGLLQDAFEYCDNGEENSDEAYDGCTTTCEYGPYCGDGVRNGPEMIDANGCDAGADNVAYSKDGKGCGYDCTTNIPYCGDGVRNGPEQCDDGTNNGDYGTCKSDCTRAPYCGDGIVQAGQGEACDDGPTGSLSCSALCKKRSVIR